MWYVTKTRAALSPGNRAKPCKFRNVKSVRNFMWKLCYRKDDRAMRPIRGCPENFRDSLTTPTATIPKIFHGLLFRSTYECSYKNSSPYSFTRSWDNREYPKHLGSSWIRPRSLFSKILWVFIRLLFVLALYMHSPNLKSVALPVPEIIGGTQKIGTVSGYAQNPWNWWYCLSGNRLSP